jgi:predicted transcriptional regulator
MIANPIIADPSEKLSAVETRMRQGNFRSMPVVEDGKVVGIVTDATCVLIHYLEHTDVKTAMSEPVVTGVIVQCCGSAGHDQAASLG